MRVHACSVAFRHAKVSATGLARYVAQHAFDGLEIWMPHARTLKDDWLALPCRPRVAMLAGYLPIGTADFDLLEARTLLDLTCTWQAPRLRLFAGGLGHRQAHNSQRQAIVADLRRIADLAAVRGLQVAIETHPGTIADSPSAAEELLEAMDHPAVGLNFDVLHIWEAGADPRAAFTSLMPKVLHLHLKNVASRRHLPVFASGNVHDPQGSRLGMCPLFRGTLDYRAFLTGLPELLEGSLEWFGPDPEKVMAADLTQVRDLKHMKAA